jgi:hypothetical protein
MLLYVCANILLVNVYANPHSCVRSHAYCLWLIREISDSSVTIGIYF